MITVHNKQTKEPIRIRLSDQLIELGDDQRGVFVKHIPYYSNSFCITEYIAESYEDVKHELQEKHKMKREREREFYLRFSEGEKIAKRKIRRLLITAVLAVLVIGAVLSFYLF
jgi:hypothetical protein